MSSTHRGAERQPDDFYATPAWAVAAILPHLRVPQRVLDPACGAGALIKAASARWGGMIESAGMDITDHGWPFATIRDALSDEPWPASDLVLANPPFSLAMEFLERALVEVHPGGDVCFLLRLAWMAGQKRAAFHKAHPSDVYVLPRRPSFTGKGTDSADYAWFCFGPGRGNRWFVLDVKEAA